MKKVLNLFSAILFFCFSQQLKAQVSPPVNQNPLPIKETWVDLVVSDFRITSISPQQANYTCTVKNIGDKALNVTEGLVGVQIYYYASLEDAREVRRRLAGGGNSLPVKMLLPGETSSINYVGSGDFTESKYCSMTVDLTNLVKESNEKNNTKIIPVPSVLN